MVVCLGVALALHDLLEEVVWKIVNEWFVVHIYIEILTIRLLHRLCHIKHLVNSSPRHPLFNREGFAFGFFGFQKVR